MTLAKVTDSPALVLKEGQYFPRSEAKLTKCNCTHLPTDMEIKYSSNYASRSLEILHLKGINPNELENFKLAFTDHKSRGVYLSKFHEKLEKLCGVKGICILDVIVYQHLESKSIITPITTELQKERCNMLEIQFQQSTD
ncbi:hypothetical protein LOD99_15863 [Oopsacas minuta]|uniref:Uncharacterized protein n=1 Tax=Oopsacas minuta TaxID=111878 RepID=A0AAV7K726_9METZ|nr:hypothetical protein LOD99_15863 [Oopsacas minuta]